MEQTQDETIKIVNYVLSIMPNELKHALWDLKLVYLFSKLEIRDPNE